MERTELKVTGMSCTNCALSIEKYLKSTGLQNIKVNFMSGEVSFDTDEQQNKQDIEKGIEQLGYGIQHNSKGGNVKSKKQGFLNNHFKRFLFCIVFTAPLMIHMIPGVHIHVLMNPYLQLILSLPVYFVGMRFFGRSALKSLSKGVPNMNVLIALGSSAAFFYSLYGLIVGKANEFLFFETACSTITLVFLGNWMEDKSIETTQASLKKLMVSQKIMAKMIAFDDKHHETIFEVESSSLRVGDLILINTGDQVPMDCKVLWGEVEVNEAILTGESIPSHKKNTDSLIGGSIVESGSVKAQVTAVGNDTILANILKLVSEAQSEKPPVQQMADRISAVFVPLVVGLALLTVIGNSLVAHIGFGQSLLRGIAVLVISCPCAMGLATPAAIAVGLGRAARKGILFKNAKSLEIFKDIKQVVFDKTGTLTTGQFSIGKFWNSGILTDEDFKSLAFSLEKYSSHPIAKCISKEWKSKQSFIWKSIEEKKGIGMFAMDKEGNRYLAGSSKIADGYFENDTHNVYIHKNDELLGWIDVSDEIRPEAKSVIEQLQLKGIKTILLSGDKKQKCEQVAQLLGLDEFYAEQSPEEKLITITRLNEITPTAMVGDGINDAPALAKASVGISLSDSSQLAMQSAQVVLINKGLENLPMALGLGKHTYLTIKENLLWAFAYNLIAIPVAALGFLSPTIGALFMGLSDVVLGINSMRLNWKKVL